MKAIIIKEGIIENIVLVESLEDFPLASPYIDGAEIGDEVIDGTLVKKKKQINVPQSITARQTRLILLQEGLLDKVESILNTNRAWQIEWEYASEIERTHPLIGSMQQALNLTDEQVDNLFINGASL